MRAAHTIMSARPTVILGGQTGNGALTALPLRLLLLSLLLAACLPRNLAAGQDGARVGGAPAAAEVDEPAEAFEPYETIVFKDAAGLEHEEYAFREPARGLPAHVMDMFCASVKLRLYWDGFREEIKSTIRKGIYLRRMARLARHIFKDIRDADKPFNATMLSVPDEYFKAKLEIEDEKIDKAIASRADEHGDEHTGDASLVEQQDEPSGANSPLAEPTTKLKSLREKMMKKISDGTSKLAAVGKSSGCCLGGGSASVKDVMEEVETSETMRELEREGELEAIPKIKQFAKSLSRKVLLGLYTRWRTMWWLMMSCLYTKYYLWDPALDEFIKLKRSLVMWPDLQVANMQDLKCKPLTFFKRLMDVCKVLNPLMNIDFGQFNLDKLTRFKSDSS